jgi:hypothetical protein
MMNYILRPCPRCKNNFTIEVGNPVTGGMIRTVTGHCESCGYHFELALLRGKALFRHYDKLIA